MHRQHRVEQVREPNAVGFGDQPEQGAVAVEAPGAALLDQLQARLVVTVQELVRDLAGPCLVGQLESLAVVPLD